jgi:hypothetical protein
MDSRKYPGLETVFIGISLQTIDPIIFQFYKYKADASHIIDNLYGDSACCDYVWGNEWSCDTMIKMKHTI